MRLYGVLVLLAVADYRVGCDCGGTEAPVPMSPADAGSAVDAGAIVDAGGSVFDAGVTDGGVPARDAGTCKKAGDPCIDPRECCGEIFVGQMCVVGFCF